MYAQGSRFGRSAVSLRIRVDQSLFPPMLSKMLVQAIPTSWRESKIQIANERKVL